MPSWSDFGGRADKENYARRPVSNPRQQTDALEYVSLGLAVTQMAPVSPFCVMRILVGDSTNVVKSYKSQAGASLTLAPVIEVNGTGRYLLKWPSSLVDQSGETYPVSLGSAFCSKVKNASSIIGGLTFETSVVAANQIEIGVWNPGSSSYISTIAEIDVMVFPS